MVKSLIIEATEDTPKVFFNTQNGVFEISGRSFPEDASRFYVVVLSWLQEYMQDPCLETRFCFNLEYFNSSSYKQLLEVLTKLKEITLMGKAVHIIWSYGKHDELMAAKGEEIKDMVNMSFELNPVE